ncbi:MAG: IMP dehydrogenase, partial [Synergistaceae bacterium]|nr:IMP dehydrogenase [Synergistaceae bacterium]
MAYYYNEPSRTFNEYLLVPGYSPAECVPANTSLKTPVAKFRKGEEPPLSMSIPLVSAIMQAVSNDTMAIALAKEGGISFIYASQSVARQSAMVRKVKDHKAGFVGSDSNIRPEQTLQDILDLKEKTGHSTVAITDDGTPNGKLIGIVTGRDYRVTRMAPDTPVHTFMTPIEKIIYAPEGTSLKEANNIIWSHKLNTLPVLSAEGHLVAFVFRKDYTSNKENPLELTDARKRYVVGAGINTRDYRERVPALVEAGADILCIDSS